MRNVFRIVFWNALEASVVENLLETDFFENFRHEEEIDVGSGVTEERKCILRFLSGGELVDFIFIRWEFIGDLQIDFLPHTVRKITLEHCKQRFEIRTQCFPRDLQAVYFWGNQIRGSVDLQNLPRHLEHLDVQSNRLSGTIHLESLPKNLRVLNLSRNADLGQPVLIYGQLPNHIVKIDVSKTCVRKVIPEVKEYRVKGKKIFEVGR